MKLENLNRIKSLLDKYESGQTSLEEERILKTYFNSEEVANELHHYQAEFNYYAAFRNIRFTGSLKENIKTKENSFVNRIRQFISKWYLLPVFVLLSGLIFILLFPNHQPEVAQTILYQKDKANQSLLQTNTDSVISQKITAQLDDSDMPSKTNSPSTKKIIAPFEDSLASVDYPTSPDLSIFQKTDSAKIATQSPDTFILPDSTTADRSKVKIQNRKNIIDEQREVVFNLSENSTSGELAKIAYLADKAGIEYTYVVDMHRKKIHELNIVMVIRSTGKRSQLWISVPKKSSFKEVLSWTVDENEDAVSLCASKIEHKAKAKHPLN